MMRPFTVVACGSLASCAAIAGLGTDYVAGIGVDAGAADAGRDDGEPSDAGPPGADRGFCVLHPGHAFCSDFDEGEAGTGWDSLDVANGATLDVAAAHAISAPFALVTTVSSSNSPSTQGARVIVTLPPVTKKVTLDFDAFFEVRPTNGEVTLFTLQTDDANAYGVRLKLGVQQSHVGLSAGGTYTESTANNVPFGVPFHFQMVVTLGVDVVFRYGDGQPDSTAPFPGVPGGPLLLKLGMLASPQNGPGRAYYDDVTIDVE